MEPVTSESRTSPTSMLRTYLFYRCLYLLFFAGALSLVLSTGISRAYAANSPSANPSFSFAHLAGNVIDTIGAVNAVVRDHKGFMWFGGQDGLARYDGYSVEVFKSQPSKGLGPSHNYIYDILEDSLGNLWIATRSGVDKFNRDSDTFIHYSVSPEGASASVLTIFEHSSGTLWLGTRGSGLRFFDRESAQFMSLTSTNGLSNNVVYAIAEDSAGDLWIGTERGGLNHMNLKTRQFRHFKNEPENSSSLSDNDVRSIIVDTKDNVWVGTFGGGLNYYDISKRRFNRYDTNAGSSGLSDAYIRDMHIDRDAYLWIATENGGLNKFDPKSKTFVHYRSEKGNQASLDSNSPMSIYEDTVGDLWIGLSPAGVDTLNKSLPRFTRYTYKPGDVNGLTHREVTAVAEGKNNSLWIGTPNGLNRIDRRTGITKQYKPRLSGSDGLAAAKILSLLEDSKGRLWIGTQGAGVNRLDPRRDTFVRYPVNPERNKGISGQNIQAIYEDKQGNVWFGSESGGLTRYDEQNNRFTRFVHIPGNERSISANMVNAIHEDTQGRLWVGTANGLSVMERGLGIFRHYQHDPGQARSLADNHVTSIAEDSRGRLWVATQLGFSLFNEKDKNFINLSVSADNAKGGLTDLIIDSRDGVWLGMPDGLVRYDVKENTYKAFDKRHGFFGSIRSSNASIAGNNGELILGSTQGVSIFDPATVENNLMIPQVAITDFTIFDKSVVAGAEGSPLQKTIGQTQSITLSPDQSVFSFTFSVLNYRSPEDNKYSYMLEGFDESWTSVSRDRTATYSNVAPGKYTFRVFGYNNEGVRSGSSTNIEVIIKPKMWQTWSKYAPYIVLALVVASIFFVVGAVLRFIANKQREYQRQIASVVAKSRKKLQKKAKKKKVDTQILPDKKVTKKPRKAVALTHEKADIEFPSKKPVQEKVASSKKQPSTSANKKIKDSIRPVDIHTVVAAVVLRSKTLVGKKQLKVVNRVSKQLPPSTLNEERLEKALYNLVANSIRISDRGNISVSVEQKGAYLLFKVTNNSGKGSSSEKLKSVFNDAVKNEKKNTSSFVFTLPFPLGNDRAAPVEKATEVPQQAAAPDAVIEPKNNAGATLHKNTKEPHRNIKGSSPSTKNSAKAKRTAAKLITPAEKSAEEIPTLSSTLTKTQPKTEPQTQFVSRKKNRDFAARDESSENSNASQRQVKKAVRSRGADTPERKVAESFLAEEAKAASKMAIQAQKQKPARSSSASTPPQNESPAIDPALVAKAISSPEWEVPELEAQEIDQQRAKDVEDGREVKSIMVNIDVNEERNVPKNKLQSHIGARGKKNSSINRKQFVERLLGDTSDTKSEHTEVDVPVEKKPEVFVDFTDGLEDASYDSDDEIERVVADCHIKLIKSANERDESYRHHILIVDENPVKRMILQNYLSSENYRVSQIENGSDVIALIEKHGGIDLVILGEMQEGLSGHEVCEEIRANFSSQDLPVVFTVDMASDHDIDKCYKVGGNDVLTKKESKENFISRIKKQISILEYNRSQGLSKDADDADFKSINSLF